MAIAFKSSSSATQANGGNATVSFTGMSLSEGDFVLVAQALANTSDQTRQPGFITTTGWTPLGHVRASDVQDVNLQVWGKFMGASPDASAIVTGTALSTESNAVVAMAFTGVDRTRPLDVAPTTATGVNSGIVNPPAITKATAGAWTVIVGGSASNNGFSATFTFPTGYTTNGVDAAGNDTDDVLAGMGYNSSPSSPEDPGAMTPSYGDSVDFSWAAMTIALRPAETSGIYFVGSTSAENNNGQDVTLTLPTCLEDDLVIIAVGDGFTSDIDVAMDSTTDGGAGSWTEVADLYANDSNDINLGVFYKFMGATPDTTAVVAGTGNTSDSTSAVLMVFRNVDTTTPMDVAATTATGTNSGNANPPSIDYSDPNALIVVAAGTGHAYGASGGLVLPTNYIGQTQASSDTWDSMSALAYKGSHLATDPEDPGEFLEVGLSGNPDTTDSWAAVTMALRPVAAGGGSTGFFSIIITN